MKYIKRIILLIAVVFATTLQAQTKTFNSQVRVKQVPLSSSLDSLVTINSSGLLTYLPKSELASGGALEFITEGGNTGIAIKGRNPDNYGDIGFGAIDLSHSNIASTTRGAVGTRSLVAGASNRGGTYSFVAGLENIVGQYGMSTGVGNFAPSWGEVSIGVHGTDYSPNSIFSFNANDRLFNLGNGTDENNRSDALTVYKSGNATLNGDLTVDNIIGNGSQLTNVDAVSVNSYNLGVDSSIDVLGSDLNLANTVGFSAFSNIALNNPNVSGAVNVITASYGSNRDAQIIMSQNEDKIWFRRNFNTWTTPVEFYHTGNFTPSVVNDVLTLTPRAEPSSPVKGMVYYDSATDLIRYYNGTVWVTL